MKKNNLPFFLSKHTHQSLCITLQTLGLPVWILMVSWCWGLVCLSASPPMFSSLIHPSAIMFFISYLYLSGEGLCWACTLFQLCFVSHSHINTLSHQGAAQWPLAAVGCGAVTSGQRVTRSPSLPGFYLFTHTHTLSQKFKPVTFCL